MVTGLLVGSAQAAPDGPACLKAYENAQLMRKQEDFIGARAELIVCASATCPVVVQNDCVEWLGKVEDAIPLVILEAKINGSPVYDVSVSVDGKRVVEHLDGKSIEVNPGLHTFTFTRDGGLTATERAIVHRGEKSRTVMASWMTPTIGSAATVPPAAPPSIPKARPIPTLFYVLGGVGVLGFGAFATLGITGLNQEQDLGNTCSHICSDSSIQSLKMQYAIADISAGVGVVSLVAAGIVFFNRPERPTKTGFDFSRFGVHPTPSGTFITWREAF